MLLTSNGRIVERQSSVRIAVFGIGYVGLVTAIGFAENGHSVICVDIDEPKLERLANAETPFFEPGLGELLQRNLQAKRIRFSSNSKEAIQDAEVLFIAVGTPPLSNGDADLQAVCTIAQAIGTHMNDPKIIVNKSTVPVGSAERVKAIIESELRQRDTTTEFHVVSNPEFLKEGTAVEDVLKPDRIVVGASSEHAFAFMRELYAPFQRRENILIEMDIPSAELTKYAANAMLAARISLMNELSQIAERVGADIESVRRGVGSDPRIGSAFLYSGCGYGGSCFPKDISALISTANSLGARSDLLEATQRVNQHQQKVLLNKIVSHFGNRLTGNTFAVWGLSFKPDTDDMRNAPSIPLINGLSSLGARVNAYDPVAAKSAELILGNVHNVNYPGDKYSALEDADALILVTEWKEFRSPDFDQMLLKLKHPTIFDGRNQWDPTRMRELGFTYFGIGRGESIVKEKK